MRKSLFFISLIALFASCTKEPANDADVVSEVELVPVTVTANADTKATIGEMKWENDDKLTVWVESDVDSNPSFKGYELDLVEILTDGKAIFYGEIAYPQDTDTYYAAYGAVGFDKENREPLFDIQAVQNSAAAGATKALLKGRLEGSKADLFFQMTAATAKLSITVDKDVTGVEFAGLNNEEIAVDVNKAASKTISYAGASTKDIQLIVPAMAFTKGYRLTYTDAHDNKMYQAYASSGVTFEAGKKREVSCTFVPFGISCEIDAANAPKTSYDYYLAGNITKANSADFETVGRLSGGTTEDPWTYDEDAQGLFTGKIEKGKAKVVVSGMSSTLIPSNLKITEYGCYVQRVGGAEGKDTYATGQSIALTKSFSWDVMYKVATPDQMIEVDAGDIELKPYIVVSDGTTSTEYKAPAVYTLHVTGLPHRSDHKDLWYVCTTGSGSDKVSGVVERHEDDAHNLVDMFRQKSRNGWEDYCVRTRYFNIPAQTNAQVIMHGTLWAPHSINAYFWFDAAKDAYVFHKDVDRTGSSGEKLKNLSDCDAYDEESEARQNTQYFDLGTTHGHVNNNTVTLSPDNPAVSVYLWIHRGTTVATDYVGYWCRYIKVQYAVNAN